MNNEERYKKALQSIANTAAYNVSDLVSIANNALEPKPRFRPEIGKLYVFSNKSDFNNPFMYTLISFKCRSHPFEASNGFNYKFIRDLTLEEWESIGAPIKPALCINEEDETQKFYTVNAYRWGDRELHSYSVGVYTNKQAALQAAESEAEWRGGKYECEVLEWIPDSKNEDGSSGMPHKIIQPLPPINTLKALRNTLKARDR
jgi:hypothetical protein